LCIYEKTNVKIGNTNNQEQGGGGQQRGGFQQFTGKGVTIG